MIVKNGTDPIIEKRKRRRDLHGDVYIFEKDGVKYIEDLAGHKRLLNSMGVVSTATTIEEAEAERIAYEKDIDDMKAAEAAKAAEEADERESEGE